ncbi:MAG: hypothetical protein IPN16_18470 [Gemmatimonadetes bacterium]|nr:hypothetical protein [Gemmatimonadota bacterium]MBK9411416.1 hypothetical protein [Gemmatimonadota bacterium]MBP9105507.1 hypothetical protein [Gemmatimonadaceae bacterium]
MTHTLRAALAVLLVPLVGCHSSTSLDEALRESAFVRSISSSATLVSAPMTLRAGIPFDLVLRTYPADGCSVVDRTELTRNSKGEFVITPYNRSVLPPSGSCGVALPTLAHTVRLTYATAGRKRLIVRGRDFDSKAAVQVEVTLVVEP